MTYPPATTPNSPATDPPHPTPDLWNWKAVGFTVLLTAVVSFVVIVGLRVVGIPPNSGMVAPAVYVASVTIYGSMLLGVYLFAARRYGWQRLGWLPPSWLALAAVPVLLLGGLIGMAVINLGIAAVIGEFDNPQLDGLTGGQAISPPETIALLLLVAVLVPIVEELFFRGMIYPLLRRHGAVVAIVGSAALFSVAHFIPLVMPALFFIGLILGALREWSRSVIPGIVFHAFQNGLVILAVTAAMGQG